MKIIMSKEDITDVLKKAFNGIRSVNIEKDGSVSLDVDFEKFTTPKTIKPMVQPQSVHKSVPKTLEEKNVLAAKKGTMAYGGSARTMIKM